MRDDEVINLWPALADFMLALVLIFLVCFGISELGGVNPDKAKDCEEHLKSGFLQGDPAVGSVEFEVDSGDPFLLRVRFADTLLFAPDDAVLNSAGESMLKRLAVPMSKQLDSIKEIQIHGHADNIPSSAFPSNVHLAAERAVSVYRFLSANGIDPNESSMSATSYGDYFPVGRQPGVSGWNSNRIDAANADVKGRARNRRVELLIRYGSDVPGCEESGNIPKR